MRETGTTKAFFDVFPSLRLNGELRSVFSKVDVTKIGKTRDGSEYHIYLRCKSLIQKTDIFKTENELRNQVFKGTNIRPRIREYFILDGDFSLETLFDIYGESISLELRQEYPIFNQLYRRSDIECSGNKLKIAVPGDILFGKEAERLADRLCIYLSDVFNKRLGKKMEIQLSFKTGEASPERQREEEALQREFKELMKRETAPENAPLEEGTKKKEAEASKTTGSLKNRYRGKGGTFNRGAGRAVNPDVIYKHDFDGTPIEIRDIVGAIGSVIIRGQLISYDETPIKNDRFVVSIGITDYTDTISMKFFIDSEEREGFREAVGAGGLEKRKPGIFVAVKGEAEMDSYEHDIVIMPVRGMKKIPSFITPRKDLSSEKRTELHCHTKFSEMDGVSSVEDLLKTADSWGWNSLALTDHGNVQVFPIANHVKLNNPDFKLIYGCEGYLVDDTNNIVWNAGDGDGMEAHSLNSDYVVFDIETTGFSPLKNKIIEIGAVRVSNGEITDTFDEFVNPETPIPFVIENLTGINDSMVRDADTIDRVLPRFLSFAEGAVSVAHNAAFDTSFISKNAEDLGLKYDKTVVDTMGLSRFLMPELNNHKLDTLTENLKVKLENHHRACDDALATAHVFLKLLQKLSEDHSDEVNILEDLKKYDRLEKNTIKKLPYYHIILLAKNETGRVNLYKLVSESHLNYFQRRPRIPRSLLSRHREGLILGSACEAGELFRALEKDASDERIARIVDFYDYLEIQPIGNNEFLLREGDLFKSVEDLRDINRKIVRLGEQFKKPVCATCDVHFLNPEDEIYRRIIMFSKGYKDADMQAPLYLRTTEEMLSEFSYLGDDKAREVVIKNPNMIADMIDRISPVRPDKAPPVIENSDQILRDICYDRARELYGEELPEIVTNRLETELKSIIGNGYAVMYVIAQKLVWKSNEDGYLVGSRGSVGSSFAAFMSGITEVNSLAPHYLCPKCHYSDFESDIVKKAHEDGICGCDLPDRDCPVCGEKLHKLGFDIPFETFLGFSGDKEPDIDLNFSGDYQSKAHKYTEVIFGAGQTFRAGTIGTVADKTAYGYVLKYFEDEHHSGHRRRAEIERLSKGCEGVLRTTGQHPGGIVVMPRGEEINTFTPIQHPADDQKNPTITTHFEYHSIDHNLLKLDILGHDDPTMIRFLQDETKVDPMQIPFDDKKVMSLFNSPEALGITPEDIGGCPTGSLGIPEFGTDFVIQMLVDTHPTTFSDLVRISGLSHGTDVWTGNAQTLVNEKGMKLSECICCRDDIMLYLMNMHMKPALSFKTMESVRKGKGLTDEMKGAMKECSVPDWYVDSCLKIKYMFPKAHAVAYVMMAWRVAWFKLYKPLAYYSAFFSIRAKGTGIDYETMCMGRAKLENSLKELLDMLKEIGKNRMKPADLDTIKNMVLVREMYARGFDFVPIDLNTVDAAYFKPAGERSIMPPLSSVSGMGGKDADDLVNAFAKTKDKGPFLSVDDFISRTGCSKNKAVKLKELGILGNIPQSNQMSIFDMMGA